MSSEECCKSLVLTCVLLKETSTDESITITLGGQTERRRDILEVPRVFHCARKWSEKIVIVGLAPGVVSLITNPVTVLFIRGLLSFVGCSPRSPRRPSVAVPPPAGDSIVEITMARSLTGGGSS
jgi:hypothetical protein